MNLKDNLAKLRDDQYQTLKSFEALIQSYDEKHIVAENESLKKENLRFHQELEQLKSAYEALRTEKAQLQTALSEQIADERLSILKISRRKLDTYFTSNEMEQNNRLVQLESRFMDKLTRLKALATKNLNQFDQEFQQKLNGLHHDFEERFRMESEQLREAHQQSHAEIEEATDALGQEELTPEIINRRVRQNQWEMKIGLGLINKIGILLILLGVGAAFNYTFHTFMNDYMKGICFFLLGAVFLIAGEGFYRKGKTAFSLGLLGGGVSILYGSLFYSHFLLRIISVEAALLLSILVTATTIALSLRYKSPTVCLLGLIGGYLPLLSYIKMFGLAGNHTLGLIVYLFLLHTVTLIIGATKRWGIVHWFSFFLNLPCWIYIATHLPNPWWASIYTIITFLLYLTVFLSYPVIHKIALRSYDLILIGLNGIVGSIILYVILSDAKLGKYHGLLTIALCMLYICIGQFIQKKLPQEKGAFVLFFATALTFAILVIPFQFGVKWLALGWLVEGIVLISCGLRYQIKGIKIAGWGIFLLCLYTFYQFELSVTLYSTDVSEFFDLKYLSIILGQLLVLFIYISAKHRRELIPGTTAASLMKGYKYCTLGGIWVFLSYYALSGLHRLYPSLDLLSISYYRWMLFALCCFVPGYLFSKVSVLDDSVVRGFRYFLYGLGDLVCILLNLTVPVLAYPLKAEWSMDIIHFVVLIVFNVFVFLNIHELLKAWIIKRHRNLELLPLWLGIYLLATITTVITAQLHLGHLNLLISLCYLVLALGYIVYGFARRFIFIRRLGLGLVLFSTAKLCFYDLSYLKPAGRIIAYFSFGLALLLISYLYQRVKTNLEGYHETQHM